jgi:tetratricopeptide (TPR) repeat protein
VILAGIILALSVIAAAQQSPGYAAYERANTLFVAKKLPEALAAADEALRLDPRLVPALTLKAKMAMAASRLEEALAIDPRAPYTQFLYGLQAYLGNDMKEALPRFRKAHELAPKDSRATLYLALTVESLGRPEEAMSLYQESVRQERSPETLLPGARLLLLLDRLTQCGEWLEEAEKLAPNSRDVHFELARLFLKKDDPVHAATEGETALRLSDGTVTDASIHYLLVRAYRQSGSPDRAAAHAEIIRALETPVKNPGH